MKIHERIVRMSLVAGALLAGVAARAAVPIVVQGGADAPRKIAERAARAYGREPSTEALEDLLASVGAALARAGWGNGTLEASVDSLAEGSRIRLRLEGVEPTRLSGWRWDPAGRFAAPAAGAWDPAHEEERIESLLDDVQESGRPFASIQITDVADSARGLVVTARLLEGPEVVLASAEYEGRGATRASYLDRITGLRRGGTIRPGEARAARERIERTGLFTGVEGPWLRVLQEDQASLVYRMTALAQNRAEGAVGYDGSQKNLSGFLHVDLGNLFGTGRQFAASWDRYRRNRSSLSLGYREPFLGPLPIAGEFALSQRLEDTTWTADQARLGIDGDLTGGIRVRLAVAGNRTIQRGLATVRTRRVDTILGLAIDRRSDAGTAGSLLDLEVARGAVRRSPRLESGEGTLVRLSGRGERSFSGRRKGQLRLGIIGGMIDGPDSLPRPDALPVGGGTNLRGYPEEFFLAERYATVTVEAGVRMLPEGNRVYVFSDAALIRPWNGGPSKRLSSYGFGVRVRSSGGWVRLDYGVPAGEGPLSGRIHFRLETRF
jgi:outer membrane protein assembly factor BamA